MSSNFYRKYQKRSLIKNYISLTIIITIVLFFVGFLGLVLLNSKKVANYFKEQIVMTVYLEDNSKEIEITQIQKKLLLNNATKKIKFITKEDAAENFSNEIGENFVDFLGYNPLLNSIDIYFNASYVNNTFLKNTSNSIKKNKFVNEVVFDEPLINILNNNIRKISYLLIIISLLFLFVAFLLINSSIKLTIYSKRFIIKTMQLVGAKKYFIQKPFLIQHFKIGLISSVFALTGLFFLLYQLNNYFPELKILESKYEIILIFISVLLIGTSISFISTFFASKKYLNLKTEKIY
ncbi:MAG: cell division protein FtsX [Flavobacteriaceae bacterium]|nr:cell division protein FtsX [Flavobacteriaceae bacterium]